MYSIYDLVKKNTYITLPVSSEFWSLKRHDVLTSHIREFGFKVGAELGVSSGETFFSLLKSNPNLFLYGIDTWKLQEDNKLEDYSDDLSLDERKNIVFSQLNMFPNRCKIYEERTDEAYKHFKNDSLDFIFIDADHSYKSVKKDIELWTPKVKTTGMIFGHDVNWGDVARAVGEEFKGWFFNADNVWSSTRHHYRKSSHYEQT